ncbi:MAG: Sec-independent protein translocase protein TatB [Gordonia sp. (in: high G+C Gram-positive bacteria)]
MFQSVGWGEILILLAAALIILGPERLPGAITWVMQSLRKVREYASGATSQLQDEMGADFDDFREPIKQLNELRQMTPKALITKHLLDGDSSTIDSLENSVRESLSFEGPSPVPTSAPGPVDVGPVAGTQVDPGRLDKPAAAPPSSGPRKHDVTDWDAT